MQHVSAIYEYRFPGVEISFHSTRRITFPEINPRKHQRVILNFSGCSWITPYGIIFLYAFIICLRMKYPNNPIRILFPAGTDMFSYACRMNLPQSLMQLSDVSISPEPVTYRRQNRSLSLCELQTVKLENEDEADTFAEKVLTKIIQHQITDDEKTTDLINTGLSELLSNVYVHSGEKEAIVAAQTYAPANRPKGVSIAIGDIGIGIPGSLRPVLGYAKDDKTLIRESLESGVSVRGEGGFGLSELNAAIAQHDLWKHRALMIRSNGGWLWSSGESTARGPLLGDVDYFVQGTFTCIMLRNLRGPEC